MTKDQQIAAQIRTIRRLRERVRDLEDENRALSAQLAEARHPAFVAHGEIISVEPNIYDDEEIRGNCTVQILRNSQTGAFSFGWWENDG